MAKLYIILVGLPARGKSFMAERLLEGLGADGLRVKVFNNGELRRKYLGKASASPEFYSAVNPEARRQRDELALLNMRAAKGFLSEGGHVAILDATNGSRLRRAKIEAELTDAPLLYIECINRDADLLEASISRKALLPEFAGMSREEAVESFRRRIRYYEEIFTPLREEAHFARVETLENNIVEEHGCQGVPYYIQIRDILVSDWVRNLYLVRHSESEYNIEGRIGGDAPLTDRGRMQATALARHFSGVNIPYVFTSTHLRSAQTAAAVLEGHPGCVCITLPEFDEINAGICDGLTYDDIRRRMPEEYAERSRDKYHYIYPGGEGYVTLKPRVAHGFRKALFLSGAAPGILLIGHQAINRMILSLFMYRRDDSVPYIYVPQNEYFHIIATHRKKLMELVRFM